MFYYSTDHHEHALSLSLSGVYFDDQISNELVDKTVPYAGGENAVSLNQCGPFAEDIPRQNDQKKIQRIKSSGFAAMNRYKSLFVCDSFY